MGGDRNGKNKNNGEKKEVDYYGQKVVSNCSNVNMFNEYVL